MSYRSEYKYYQRQHETRNFSLLIYKSEYQKIQAWTDKYQDLETGGDLFGLWANDNTAVVQLVLGPGKKCKRTATSFYQDLDYLERLGNLLTNKEEGLCHIGEWHSHHRLGLPRPSGGDEDTVWSNMNRYGLSRFCLLIANIKWSRYRSETTVNGFLFEVDSTTKRRLPVLQGNFHFLEEESPLRSKSIDALCEGAEDSLAQRDVPLNQTTDSEKLAQRIKELEESLASERCAREQMERKLQGCEKRSRDHERSLAAERQARKETERKLKGSEQAKEEAVRQARGSEQRYKELERSFTAEKEAKEETERGLQRSEQRSHELERSLDAVRQARKETERKLKDSEQRSHELERSLAAERQARKETERKLKGREQAKEEAERQVRRSEKRYKELERSFTAERQAKQEAERQRERSEEKCKQLETSLAEEREVRESVQKQLQRSQITSIEPGTSLAAKRNASQLAAGRLHNVEHRSNELETSLIAERKTRVKLEEKLRCSEQSLRDLETSERQAKKETTERLQGNEERVRDLETSLAAERRAKEDTERQLQSKEQRLSELEISLAEEQKALAETEERLQGSEKKSEELRTRLATVEFNLEEYRSSGKSCDWILDRNKITLSDEVIGEGGLGKVTQGTFGGCKVAVKKIHQPISSPDDRDLFQREMSIAFRCHHPCLLEILGATNDDESPLIVTELMDTNLRAVLDERPLDAMEIKTVALDVAKGLNYLHLRSPNPIIHGRISSGNVLLWRHGSDGWHTKLSDYGTVNFLQQSKNVCSGRAEVYAAPEARAQPSTQSPKADMYSFGVLLFEMITNELPDIEQRDRQIVKVKHQYRRIITRCWRYRFDALPDIIKILEKFQ